MAEEVDTTLEWDMAHSTIPKTFIIIVKGPSIINKRRLHLIFNNVMFICFRI